MESVQAMMFKHFIRLLLATWSGWQVWAGTIEGQETGNNTLHVGVLIPWSKGLDLGVGPFIGSAAAIGFEEVVKRDLLSGRQIVWQWRNTECDAEHAAAMVEDLWTNSVDLNALIGGLCDDVCEVAAKRAATLNIPFVSFGCKGDFLSNKAEYPTFTRSVNAHSKRSLFAMFDTLLERFGWDNLALIAVQNQDIAQNLHAELKKTGYTITFHQPLTTVGNRMESHSEARELIQTLKGKTHIFILLMHEKDMKNFLWIFNTEDMLNGENVFITTQMRMPIIQEEIRKSAFTSSIFHGLVSANIRPPVYSEWAPFAQKVIDHFQILHQFSSVPHLSKSSGISEVDVHAGFLHDAILQWAHGVNKSVLIDPKLVDNGELITKNILSMQYHGITGNISIDKVGDRMLEYDVQIFQKDNFLTLFEWNAPDDKLVKVYKPNSPSDWSEVTWSGGAAAPPKGSPLSFKRGEKGAMSSASQKSKPYFLSFLMCIVLFYKLNTTFFTN